MNSVKKEIDLLLEEFKNWQGLIFSLGDEKIATLRLENGWTIKDVIGHLTAWQQVTLAKLTAAYENKPPQYPGWFPGVAIETENELNQIDEVIHQIWAEKPWLETFNEWQYQFQTILSLCLLIPEEHFLTVGQFNWIGGYPLVAILERSRDHHEEHRQFLNKALQQ
mgnify:FL=1